MDSVFAHWTSVTGGRLGVKSIPAVMGIYSPQGFYFITLAYAVLVLFAMYRLSESRFGAELMAIGDDDDLAEAIGIPVLRHRVMAFGLGAMFAGFNGSIFAHYIGFISPNSFGLWFTVYILIWCVLGGERKFWGPITGAAFLTIVAEFIRMSGALQAVFYASMLLIVVLAIPHGVVGVVDAFRGRSKNTKNFRQVQGQTVGRAESEPVQ
jgi:branched-chain amino acid transport system permease protein